MTWTGRNERYLQENGRDVTKMEREQTGTDERNDPIYEYTTDGETVIKALVDFSNTETDKGRTEIGTRERGRATITILDAEPLPEKTRFEIDGFVYNIEQRRPPTNGLRDLVLKRLQA